MKNCRSKVADIKVNNNWLDYFNFNIVVHDVGCINGITPWQLCFFVAMQSAENRRRRKRQRRGETQGEFKLRANWVDKTLWLTINWANNKESQRAQKRKLVVRQATLKGLKWSKFAMPQLSTIVILFYGVIQIIHHRHEQTFWTTLHNSKIIVHILTHLMLLAVVKWLYIPFEGDDELAGIVSFVFAGVDETFFSCRCWNIQSHKLAHLHNSSCIQISSYLPVNREVDKCHRDYYLDSQPQDNVDGLRALKQLLAILDAQNSFGDHDGAVNPTLGADSLAACVGDIYVILPKMQSINWNT